MVKLSELFLFFLNLSLKILLGIRMKIMSALTCVCAHRVPPVHVWPAVQKHVSPLWVSQYEGWAHLPILNQSAYAWNCLGGRRRPQSIRWWRHWEWGGGWTSLRASMLPCDAGKKKHPVTEWVSCGLKEAGELVLSCFDTWNELLLGRC